MRHKAIFKQSLIDLNKEFSFFNTGYYMLV